MSVGENLILRGASTITAPKTASRVPNSDRKLLPNKSCLVNFSFFFFIWHCFFYGSLTPFKFLIHYRLRNKTRSICTLIINMCSV